MNEILFRPTFVNWSFNDKVASSSRDVNQALHIKFPTFLNDSRGRSHVGSQPINFKLSKSGGGSAYRFISGLIAQALAFRCRQKKFRERAGDGFLLLVLEPCVA